MCRIPRSQPSASWISGERERSRTLILFHAPAQSEAVLAIAESYRVRFDQDAALLDDAPVDARMCVR